MAIYDKGGRRLAYSTFPKKLEEAKKANELLIKKLKEKDDLIKSQTALIREMKGRIPKSKLHHVLVASILILKEMKPVEDYTITLGKAEMIGMLMFFFFHSEEYLSESDWNSYVKKHNIPTRFTFERTVRRLLKLGLIDVLETETVKGQKKKMYFLVYNGREMAQQINWLRQQLNAIGYKPSGVDGK